MRVRLNKHALQRWTNGPGAKLFVAITKFLTLGLLTTGHIEYRIEHACTRLFDRLATEDRSHVQVHIGRHALVQIAVGGNLHARGWFAAETTASTRRENYRVRSTGYHTRHTDRVEAGRVHDDQPFVRDVLTVFVDVLQRCAAPFARSP